MTQFRMRGTVLRSLSASITLGLIAACSGEGGSSPSDASLTGGQDAHAIPGVGGANSGIGGDATAASTGGTSTLVATGGVAPTGSGGVSFVGTGGIAAANTGGTLPMNTGGTLPMNTGGTLPMNTGGTDIMGTGGTFAANTGGTAIMGAGGTLAANTGGTAIMGAGGTLAANTGGTTIMGTGGTLAVNTGGTDISGTGGTLGANTGGIFPEYAGAPSTGGMSATGTGGSDVSTAPTWTELFEAYMAPGTIGHCANCHDHGATATGLYDTLVREGQIDGTGSAIVGQGSVLLWFGGGMPEDGSDGDTAQAILDFEAWVADGAQNN